MTLSKSETRDLYRKRAKRYDLSIWIYRLCGFRIDHYRRETVAGLNLSPGDTVVELGCGTGLNFPYLENAIGSGGKIIGVDLTDRMLAVARERVRKHGWNNVELIQADISKWAFPAGVAGVFSTLAITLVPEYDAIIRRASQALKPGGRVAILDMKEPDNWPSWLVRLAVWLNRPFGVSLELANRHPWESIRKNLMEVEFKEYYLGALYLCVGEKPIRQAAREVQASSS